MRILIPLLVATTLGTACIPNETFSEYQNHNNGTRGNLTFPVVATRVVGETVVVEVTRSEEGNYDCATFPGLMGERKECRFTGTVSPVAELLEARCDAERCQAVILGTSLRVSGSQPGFFTLAVKARLADGTVLEDETSLGFATVERIQVRCAEAYRCPGPHAAFVGATFHWWVNPWSDGAAGALVGQVAIASVEPAGIVEAGYTADEQWGLRLTVKALKSGTATIRLVSGGQERRQVVRVASPDEVVSASVRAAAPEVMSSDLDADTDVAGEVAPAMTDLFPAHFIPVWILADGTTALGGAGRVHAKTAGVEVNYPGSPGAGDLEVTEFIVGGLECKPGIVRVGATMGRAQLDFSYEQKCAW